MNSRFSSLWRRIRLKAFPGNLYGTPIYQLVGCTAARRALLRNIFWLWWNSVESENINSKKINWLFNWIELNWIYIDVQREAMVDSCWNHNHVTCRHLDADPSLLTALIKFTKLINTTNPISIQFLTRAHRNIPDPPGRNEFPRRCAGALGKSSSICSRSREGIRASRWSVDDDDATLMQLWINLNKLPRPHLVFEVIPSLFADLI